MIHVIKIKCNLDGAIMHPSAYAESGRSGHAIPFIARQTREYLNFEVKDDAKRRPPSAVNDP
jgi:hypothetical protein